MAQCWGVSFPLPSVSMRLGSSTGAEDLERTRLVGTGGWPGAEGLGRGGRDRAVCGDWLDRETEGDKYVVSVQGTVCPSPHSSHSRSCCGDRRSLIFTCQPFHPQKSLSSMLLEIRAVLTMIFFNKKQIFLILSVTVKKSYFWLLNWTYYVNLKWSSVYETIIRGLAFKIKLKERLIWIGNTIEDKMVRP